MGERDFIRWLNTAEPGDTVVYHEGPDLRACGCRDAALEAAGYRHRPGSEVGGLQWTQSAVPLVHLAQKRVEPFRVQYVAIRASGKLA